MSNKAQLYRSTALGGQHKVLLPAMSSHTHSTLLKQLKLHRHQATCDWIRQSAVHALQILGLSYHCIGIQQAILLARTQIISCPTEEHLCYQQAESGVVCWIAVHAQKHTSAVNEQFWCRPLNMSTCIADHAFAISKQMLVWSAVHALHCSADHQLRKPQHKCNL